MTMGDVRSGGLEPVPSGPGARIIFLTPAGFCRLALNDQETQGHCCLTTASNGFFQQI